MFTHYLINLLYFNFNGIIIFALRRAILVHKQQQKLKERKKSGYEDKVRKQQQTNPCYGHDMLWQRFSRRGDKKDWGKPYPYLHRRYDTKSDQK